MSNPVQCGYDVKNVMFCSNKPDASNFLHQADILWWNAFTSEFFEDDATMTINFCLEDGRKTFSECIC